MNPCRHRAREYRSNAGARATVEWLLEIARSMPGARRCTFAAEQQGPALSFTAIAPR
jgi:hypothetical protein